MAGDAGISAPVGDELADQTGTIAAGCGSLELARESKLAEFLQTTVERSARGQTACTAEEGTTETTNPARSGVLFLPHGLANDTRVRGDAHDSQRAGSGSGQGKHQSAE